VPSVFQTYTDKPGALEHRPERTRNDQEYDHDARVALQQTLNHSLYADANLHLETTKQKPARFGRKRQWGNPLDASAEGEGLQPNPTRTTPSESAQRAASLRASRGGALDGSDVKEHDVVLGRRFKPTPSEPDKTAHWVPEQRAKFAAAGHELVNPREKPSFLEFERRSRANVLRPGLEKSSYQMSFGQRPTKIADLANGQRPQHQSGSTQELFLGTAKASTCTYGYSGHIPQSAQNRSGAAVFQSKGRPQLAQVSRFNLNMSGYTGHVPRDPRNDRGTRGPTPQTTSGQMSAFLRAR